MPDPFFSSGPIGGIEIGVELSARDARILQALVNEARRGPLNAAQTASFERLLLRNPNLVTLTQRRLALEQIRPLTSTEQWFRIPTVRDLVRRYPGLERLLVDDLAAGRVGTAVGRVTALLVLEAMIRRVTLVTILGGIAYDIWAANQQEVLSDALVLEIEQLPGQVARRGIEAEIAATGRQIRDTEGGTPAVALSDGPIVRVVISVPRVTVELPSRFAEEQLRRERATFARPENYRADPDFFRNLRVALERGQTQSQLVSGQMADPQALYRQALGILSSLSSPTATQMLVLAQAYAVINSSLGENMRVPFTRYFGASYNKIRKGAYLLNLGETPIAQFANESQAKSAVKKLNQFLRWIVTRSVGVSGTWGTAFDEFALDGANPNNNFDPTLVLTGF